MAHKNTITGTLELSGEGRVNVKPDIATVRLSILTEGKTADEAVKKNAQKANELIERMLRFEIPREDMKTTGLNLYPFYSNEPDTDIPRIVGYRAQDSIAVEAPVQLAGKVFDAGVAAGANESSGISFALRNERPYREQALGLAIKAAFSEGEAICRVMGVTLSGPRSMVVTQGGGPIRMQSERAMMKSDTPVLPGELSVAASVQVVFEYHT
jgi:hypothetical protein